MEPGLGPKAQCNSPGSQAAGNVNLSPSGLPLRALERVRVCLSKSSQLQVGGEKGSALLHEARTKGTVLSGSRGLSSERAQGADGERGKLLRSSSASTVR